MAVTVSNQPIKVYITDPKTNTAHPIGGVLTADQQQQINDATDKSADSLLKNSSEVQQVNSATTFNKPVTGINNAGDDLNPLQDNEFVTYGLLTSQLTPVKTELEKIKDLPPVENLVTLDADQSFTGEIDFSNGATTANFENVEAAPNNSILNKSDTKKLVESLLTEKDYGQTEVHVVTEYPEEATMENGHIYVLCDCQAIGGD